MCTFSDDESAVQGFHNIMVTEPERIPTSGTGGRPDTSSATSTRSCTRCTTCSRLSVENKMPTPNFEDGVQNQKVLAAMEKAAATKRWVTVK